MPHIFFIAPDSIICDTAERMALELVTLPPKSMPLKS